MKHICSIFLFLAIVTIMTAQDIQLPTPIKTLKKSQIITLAQTVGWSSKGKSLFVPCIEGLELLSYRELREALAKQG